MAVILMIPSVMPRAAQRPRVIMNISLGGAPGPKTGGMQMIGGRPIQAALPSAEPQIAKTTAAFRNAAEDGAARPEAEAAHATEADCGV